MSDYKKLSKRQKEVLRLISLGNSTKEIALLLKLSPTTVKYYTSQIYETLELTQSKIGDSGTRIKAVNIYWKNNINELVNII